jgi:hypothetical protein
MLNWLLEFEANWKLINCIWLYTFLDVNSMIVRSQALLCFGRSSRSSTRNRYPSLVCFSSAYYRLKWIDLKTIEQEKGALIEIIIEIRRSKRFNLARLMANWHCLIKLVIVLNVLRLWFRGLSGGRFPLVYAEFRSLLPRDFSSLQPFVLDSSVPWDIRCMAI